MAPLPTTRSLVSSFLGGGPSGTVILGFSFSSPEVSGGASASALWLCDLVALLFLLGGLVLLEAALLLAASGGGERDGGEAKGYEVAGAHGAEE